MTETNSDNSLVKKEMPKGEDKTANEYMDDFKGQAQEYGQKFQDAAAKAKDYASERISQAGAKSSRNYRVKTHRRWLITPKNTPVKNRDRHCSFRLPPVWLSDYFCAAQVR